MIVDCPLKYLNVVWVIFLLAVADYYVVDVVWCVSLLWTSAPKLLHKYVLLFLVVKLDVRVVCTVRGCILYSSC